MPLSSWISRVTRTGAFPLLVFSPPSRQLIVVLAPNEKRMMYMNTNTQRLGDVRSFLNVDGPTFLIAKFPGQCINEASPFYLHNRQWSWKQTCVISLTPHGRPCVHEHGWRCSYQTKRCRITFPSAVRFIPLLISQPESESMRMLEFSLGRLVRFTAASLSLLSSESIRERRRLLRVSVNGLSSSESEESTTTILLFFLFI